MKKSIIKAILSAALFVLPVSGAVNAYQVDAAQYSDGTKVCYETDTVEVIDDSTLKCYVIIYNTLNQSVQSQGFMTFYINQYANIITCDYSAYDGWSGRDINYIPMAKAVLEHIVSD